MPLPRANVGRALHENVEVIAGLPFPEHDLASRKLDLLGDRGDPGELGLGARLEERYAGDESHLLVAPDDHGLQSTPRSVPPRHEAERESGPQRTLRPATPRPLG